MPQVAEEVIQAAEKGDFAPTQKLLELLCDPFSDADEGMSAAVDGAASPEPLAGVCPVRIGGKPPQWASKLCVTCSS